MAKVQFPFPITGRANRRQDLVHDFAMVVRREIIDDAGRMNGFQVAQADELATGFIDEQRIALEVGDTDEFAGSGDKRRQETRQTPFGVELAEPPRDRRKFFQHDAIPGTGFPVAAGPNIEQISSKLNRNFTPRPGPTMTLILSNDDVAKLLTMCECIEVL